MTWTLAIETSTRVGSIALCRAGAGDDGLCDERSLGPVAQKHAQTLFVEIDRALRDYGLQPADLERIGVSVGPGSFTGLRIGIVAAKTLAYALGCELQAIDSFLAAAENSPPEVNALTVLGDAQRGDLYRGTFVRDAAGDWQRVGEIGIVAGERLLTELAPDAVVTGPGVSRYEPQLQKLCRVLEPDRRHPRASAVCRLACRENIPAADPFALQPVYLRKSTAEEKWEKQRQEE